VNLQDPDPACELDYVRGTGAAVAAEFLLSNSFGFGGINATLLFRAAAN
jgi:3-oxoacyl-[acyl-carrier-protein] synthase II